MKSLSLFALALCSLAHADSLGITEVSGFFHGNGGLIAQFDGTSGNYFSTLDANNTGAFGWSVTNTTGAPINNALFLIFLDADIDEPANTYFNEYGTFISLLLSPGSPAGAIGPSSWEIDEPGFVFGDIFNHLLTGALDNTNAIPSTSPDDVSLALGFFAGTLAPGQTLTATARIDRANTGGLAHTDPDSSFTFFLNGYATTVQGPMDAVPEPGTVWLLVLPAAACLAKKRLQKRG